MLLHVLAMFPLPLWNRRALAALRLHRDRESLGAGRVTAAAGAQFAHPLPSLRLPLLPCVGCAGTVIPFMPLPNPPPWPCGLPHCACGWLSHAPWGSEHAGPASLH